MTDSSFELSVCDIMATSCQDSPLDVSQTCTGVRPLGADAQSSGMAGGALGRDMAKERLSPPGVMLGAEFRVHARVGDHWPGGSERLTRWRAHGVWARLLALGRQAPTQAAS